MPTRESNATTLPRIPRYFHIDFGHFLGNKKFALGINREQAPFVFTPEMAHVMGGKSGAMFRKFEELCVNAFNVLRREGRLLVALFELMIPAGMPELSSVEDVEFLREVLQLGESDDEATSLFKTMIRKASADTMRQVDNAIHVLAHYT